MTPLDPTHLAAALQAFENVGDAVVVIDNSCRVVYWNTAAEKLFATPKSTALGYLLEDILLEGDAPISDASVLEKIDNDGNWRGQESRYFNGRNCRLDWSASRLVLPGLGACGVLALVRDISGLARDHRGDDPNGDESGIKSHKPTELNHLAGGVAHDFNNLLTAIAGYSSLLLVALANDDPLRKDVVQIKNAADIGAYLTKQLSLYSCNQPPIPKSISAEGFSEIVLKALGETLKDGISVESNIGDCNDSISFDAHHLEHVFRNLALFGNAVMKKGGKVVLRMERVSVVYGDVEVKEGLSPGQYLRFSMHDNAPGLTEEVVDHAFEPFSFKVKSTGSGLLLPTADALMQQNNATIRIKSPKGKGTHFEMFFPIKVDEKHIEKAVNLAIEGVLHRGNERILLVEDDDLVRRLAKRALEKKGYIVLDAEDGRQAMEIIMRTRPELDLLLTDIIMPELNGKELSDQIKELYPSIRIIFMSGYSSDVVSRYGVGNSDPYFLSKPFSVESLAEKVLMALGG